MIEANITDLCTIKARIGWQGLRSDEFLSHGIYSLVTGTDIKDGTIDWSGTYYISLERYNQDTSIQLKLRDILISKDGTIGKVGYVDFLPNKATLNSGVYVVRSKDEEIIRNDFLSWFFKSIFFEDFIKELRAGSTISHLYQKDFVKLVIKYPNTTQEQRLIAEALSDVDILIREVDALIEKKRAVIQGTMQNLLSCNQRLPGFSAPWKHIIFGDMVNIYRGGSPRPIENFITTNPNGLNWIKIGDVRPKDKYIVQTSEKIIPEGLSSTREVHIGDFILSNSMSFGRPYILKINGCIHDGWLAITNYENTFDKDYLYYLLGSDSVYKQYLSLAAGSGVLNLNKKLVAAVELDIPDIKEQQAIAAILSDMDAEITELEAKRDKYAAIRQGMMQQLLTGKIRLI